MAITALGIARNADAICNDHMLRTRTFSLQTLTTYVRIVVVSISVVVVAGTVVAENTATTQSHTEYHAHCESQPTFDVYTL